MAPFYNDLICYENSRVLLWSISPCKRLKTLHKVDEEQHTTQNSTLQGLLHTQEMSTVYSNLLSQCYSLTNTIGSPMYRFRIHRKYGTDCSLASYGTESFCTALTWTLNSNSQIEMAILRSICLLFQLQQNAVTCVI